MSRTLKHILGIVLGLVSVPLVQSLITKIWNKGGVSWGPDNLPFELTQQMGMHCAAFIAGIVGPCVAVLIAGRKTAAIIISFLVIGLSIDLYAALFPLKPVALWFRISWVISVPIQVFLGVWLGLRITVGGEK